MITVITGTPGAGKTLYAIEKLLLPVVGKTVKGRDADGNEIEHERTIYTNINGLQIDHELIDGGENQGLRDWYKWAKPGALIVFDEVQKVWPPRPNGSKIPEDVQALDTHRHLGVDFILITQNVLNFDRHIHALAGRHLHVRRIANMPLATVYEWDHVSRGLLYSKSMVKHPWRYSSKVFKLYKSSELHTKVPRRVPGLVWFLLIGLLGITVLGPTVYTRIKQRTLGDQAAPESEKKAPSARDQKAPGAPADGAAPVQAAAPRLVDERVDFMPRLSDRPWTAPAFDEHRQIQRVPYIEGAICVNDECKCYSGGMRIDVTSDACRDWVERRPFNPYVVFDSTHDMSGGRIPLIGGQKSSDRDVSAAGGVGGVELANLR